MTSLFEPAQAGDIALANRIVMAPLTRNRSPGAIPNNLNATYYEQRATAGLIVTEGTPISQQGQGYADVPGLYKREAIEGWKKITDGVHSAGGKIVAQIWHVGRISHTSLQPHGGQPVAPSAITAKSKTYIINDDGTGAFAETSEPRALTIDDIGLILEDYRSGARAALEAGFDGVEIHAANGYLIEQFLKSSTNQRTDDYGGSIENRARFLLEVVDAVAEEIGAGRTGIRLSPVTPANDIFEADPQPLYNYVVGAAGQAQSRLHPCRRRGDGRSARFQAGRQAFRLRVLQGGLSQCRGQGPVDRQQWLRQAERHRSRGKWQG
ncbi:N-ethylmaleimide reductase [Agrobacterium sp. SORGH_AS440]|nr:N-ethylmaleimide reductase [Agrobacterium sp. SORGH_AS_0440]